jgi:hypothetical protein
VTGCFQVELDKGPVAGMAGPQVVQHTRLGAGLQLIPDVLAFLERQLAIEQLLQRLGRNPRDRSRAYIRRWPARKLGRRVPSR